MTRVDPEFPPSYAPDVETIAAGCAWGIVPRRAALRAVFCFVVAVGAGGGVAIEKTLSFRGFASEWGGFVLRFDKTCRAFLRRVFH
jgi:hypothetical protein